MKITQRAIRKIRLVLAYFAVYCCVQLLPEDDGVPTCLEKWLPGGCSFCGGIRSAKALMELRLQDSVDHNLLVFIVFVLVFFYFLFPASTWVRNWLNQYGYIAFLIAVSLFFCLKNFSPLSSLDWLRPGLQL